MRAARSSCKWAAFRLLLVLLVTLVIGTIGCGGDQHAVSPTTTTESETALWPVPKETGSDPLSRASYKWGYVDKDGTWVITPQFQDAYRFQDGLAPVEVGGKWGYIDETGAIVIKPQFTEANLFFDGIARVATGPPPSTKDPFVTASGYGFIDKNDHLVTPATWDAAGDFSEGLAGVMKGSSCGFIDTKGKIVIPLKFDWVGPFSEGLAQASTGGKYGFIDKSGHWRIGLRYDAASLHAVLEDNTAYLVGGRFESGLAPVYTHGSELADGTCRYIDQTGTTAFPQAFQRGGEYSEGLAPVCVDNTWGFIDTSGRMVIKPQFDNPSGYPYPDFYLLPSNGFSGGLAPVALNHQVGYIDKTGAFVVAPQYLNGTGFRDGLARACMRTVAVPDCLIDSTGRLVYQASSTQAAAGSVAEVQSVVGSWTSEYMAFRIDLTLLADGTYHEQLQQIFDLPSTSPEPAKDYSGAWSIDGGIVILKDGVQAVPETEDSGGTRWTFIHWADWILKAEKDASGPDSEATALVSELPAWSMRFVSLAPSE